MYMYINFKITQNLIWIFFSN